MMGYCYFYLTAILGSLLLGSEGASVLFTAQPTFVMYEFPQTLTLGCSFDDTQTDKDQEIQSIFITRGPTNEKQIETVAFITPFDPGTAKADLGFINVTGHLKSDDTKGQGYLNVEWKEPGAKQAAVYECKIETTLGTKKATQNINYVFPDNKQLLDKVSALEKLTLNKFETIEKSTLQKIDEFDKNFNLRIPVIENNLAAERERHMETGDVVCLKDKLDFFGGEIRTLTTRVKFKVPYHKPPVVYAAISKLDSENDRNLRIRFNIAYIDETYFKIEIETWSDTVIHEVRIKWLSYDSN